MDKIKRPFKELVLSNNSPVISKSGLDYSLGFLASFIDLREAKAKSTARSSKAIKGLEQRMANVNLL
eukprot:12920028-Prorocentrum_lima.AAC.1